MKHFFCFPLAALLLAAPLATLAQGVGIGTTAPDASAALDVRSTGQGFLPPRLTYAQRTGISNAAAGLLVYQNDPAAAPPQPNGYYFYTGTQWLPLQTAGDNLGSHTATQTLNLAGNPLVSAAAVGIGTASPDRPLTVQGTGTASQLISLKNSTGTTRWHWNLGGGGLNLAETAVADYRLFVAAGGNVGLGTNTPISRLANTASNIGGSDGFGVGTSSLTWLNPGQGYAGAFYNAANLAGGYNGLAVKVASADASTTALDVSQGATQTAPGTPLLRVRGDGFTGIGTGAPTNLLHVKRTGSSEVATLEADQGGPHLYLTQSGGGGTGVVDFIGTAGTTGYRAGALELRGLNAVQLYGDGDVASPDLTVAASGNVGIGTPTPAQALDVSGNQNLTGTLQVNTADVDKIFLTTQGAAGSKIGHAAGWGVLTYAGPGTASSGFHGWLTSTATGYQEQMRLTSAGRLGLGTTSPSSQLANTAGNTIGADGNGVGGGSLNWAASQGGYVGAFFNGSTAPSANGLAVKVAGTDPAASLLDLSTGAQGTTGTSVLNVGANGRVGLGTVSPYSRLASTATNIVGSDGNGGGVGSLAWAASQGGYAGMFFNGSPAASANGLAVKVAGTSASTTALDVSTGSQGSAGTTLFSVRANGDVLVPGTLDVGFRTVVYDFTASGNSWYARILSCPAGYRVLGGGGGHRDSNSAQSDIVVNYSGPDDANPETTWLIRISNNSGSDRAVRLRCNCARLK